MAELELDGYVVCAKGGDEVDGGLESPALQKDEKLSSRGVEDREYAVARCGGGVFMADENLDL